MFSLIFKFVANNWLWLLTIALAIIITHFVTVSTCPKKGTFVNRSSYGYKYETTSLSFIKPTDRKLARETLIAMMRKEGKTYTMEQIAHISDSFLLQILEVDDEFMDKDELIAMKAKFDILVSENYSAAYKIAYTAARAGRRLKSSSERELLYDIFMRYFRALGKIVPSQPLSQWSDSLLIQTFMTLQLPSSRSFGSTR